jgi:mevalonate kinase
MHLVHTGVPDTTTGECVARVRQQFGDSRIWDEFEAQVNSMEKALAENDLEHIQQNIRDNQRLLTRIGVVPEKVQNFISELEKEGSAGKVCGAGAVGGDKGGIVLVASDKAPTEICRKYGFELMSVRGEPLGARIV